YKTPGRDDAEEVKLYTRADVNARKDAQGDTVSALILEGLGGKTNIVDLDCCATRLRVTVADSAKVTDATLKQSGASGVVHRGNGVQVIYGPQVSVIKSRLADYMQTAAADAPGVPDAVSAQQASAPQSTAQGKDETLASCLTGTVVPLEQVDDEAFASRALGDGIAIEPTEGTLVAPADGEITTLFETGHAIGMRTADGAELLMHIGINTVKMRGQGFTYAVTEGQQVKKGDTLITFDRDAIRAAGYPLTTPLIICNTDEYQLIETQKTGTIKAGEPLLNLRG
ncbi:MAG: biotin/lipoyl-binding protein, partial [Clostridia bacterium]|nr:biotin/lipoyl-binding protein [Clostridia bacterium]